MANNANSAGQNAERFETTNDLFFSASSEPESTQPISKPVAPMTALLFQAPDVSRAIAARRARREAAEVEESKSPETNQTEENEGSESREQSTKRSRRGSRGGRRNGDDNSSTNASQAAAESEENGEAQDTQEPKSTKRTRKRSSSARKSEENKSASASNASENEESDSNSSQSGSDKKDGDSASAGVTVRRRRRRSSESSPADEVTAPKGSTRLEAKRQRRKEGREAIRRRHTITESEFLARRENVHREMLVRERDGLNQIAVLEDGVLVEHYVARHTQSSMVGNVYLGRVQNVLPSMEAAFVDIGKGRNAVLYAGEVNWDVAGLEGKPRRIENALKSGDAVLVQVTKDPIGHKGARLTSQVTLAGRHLVLVPSGAMTGISRKLPERERTRLKKILREIVPAEHGVIVRTAAEGATEEQLKADVERLMKAWKDIEAKSKSSKNAPSLLKGEPELAVRVVRDVFNEDFNALKVQGDGAWTTIWDYVQELSPELVARVEKWESDDDIFHSNRVDEQLAKAFDRMVHLPSGGTLVIDRTEAMTVIDVNTGKFTGSGGTLEETVTRNNLEAAEEIVRQLRLRDIGGIVVIDFIDMVLEANRDLVLRRLIECLGRDRTRHQVAEVTSLGLVQMTRKRVGQGLVEAFSTTCEHCDGRGYITYDHPIEKGETPDAQTAVNGFTPTNSKPAPAKAEAEPDPQAEAKAAEVRAALNNIAAAAAAAHSGERHQHEAKKAEPAKGKDVPAKEKAAPSKEVVSTKAEAGSKAVVRQRVTSAGTIIPASSATSAIMTFPKKK